MSVMWPMRVGPPPGRDPHAGAHGVDRAGVDRVEERRCRRRRACTSANANGTSSGCCAVGVATHDHDSTVPAGPTSTKSWASSSAVSGSHSSGGHDHAVAAADPDDPPVGERGHERTHHRPERSLVRELDGGLDDLCHAVPPGTSRSGLMRGDYVRRRPVCPGVALGRTFTLAARAPHRSVWTGGVRRHLTGLTFAAALAVRARWSGARRCSGSPSSSCCSSRWRSCSRCAASGRSGPGCSPTSPTSW